MYVIWYELCSLELELRDLVETARSLNLISLLEAAESVRLTEALTDGNFTIFAPTDEAFGGFEPMDVSVH